MNQRNANIIRLLTLAVLLAVTFLACSEEDNPYWYLDGNRAPGNVIPDTVWVMADRDTTVEIEINTGSSPYLFVGEHGGLEMVAYLKFTSLPDTASVAYALLDLNIDGGTGEPFQIQIQAVTSNFDWEESEIRWENRPEVDPAPLWASAEPISWGEDTTLYAAVLKIPGRIINDWIENSEGNGGIRISKSRADASLGIIKILSSEAVLDTGGVTIVNPPLTITMADSSRSVRGPAQDAYVQTRIEGDPWGSDPTWLGVGGGRAVGEGRAVALGSRAPAPRPGMDEGRRTDGRQGGRAGRPALRLGHAAGPLG
ncbi:MAG: DNRLRE domain-containing protein [Candidatus Eisenbacteria bacterium]|nr:DNRLRE domain-containing protein [Candidatus Eisenbacteria bacterium]